MNETVDSRVDRVTELCEPEHAAFSKVAEIVLREAVDDCYSPIATLNNTPLNQTAL